MINLPHSKLGGGHPQNYPNHIETGQDRKDKKRAAAQARKARRRASRRLRLQRAREADLHMDTLVDNEVLNIVSEAFVEDHQVEVPAEIQREATEEGVRGHELFELEGSSSESEQGDIYEEVGTQTDTVESVMDVRDEENIPQNRLATVNVLPAEQALSSITSTSTNGIPAPAEGIVPTPPPKRFFVRLWNRFFRKQ